eukprot:scaffold7712_cov119-Isochrysis_galbana.AAC.5
MSVHEMESGSGIPIQPPASTLINSGALGETPLTLKAGRASSIGWTAHVGAVSRQVAASV